MSTGGAFKLLTNTGFQDRVLLATDLLKIRLSQIKEENDLKSIKNSSWSVSLNQIERTHLLVTNASYKPFVTVGSEYWKVNAIGGMSLGNTFEFKIPHIAAFFSDIVLHIRLKSLTAVNAEDKVRYVAYPGHKIISSIKFNVNGITLDEITRDTYNAHYQYKVLPHKKNAWDKNMGQEIPWVGHVTPNPLVDEIRMYQKIGNGAQTFKRTHPTLDLWIPVLMWFADVKLAFPQLVVPGGQTQLVVKLADNTELVSFADYGGGGSFTGPFIEKCDIYINNIFLLPEMHDIFIKNFGFSLIRVHKQQIKGLSSEEGKVLLNELKWPVESMYIGFRPTVNLLNSQHWYKNQVLTENTIPVPVIIGGSVAINNVVYFDESPVIDFLELRSYDVCLFKETPAQFFHSYLPGKFGDTINVGSDTGWHMMNFGFTPGEYQPTGYLNVSKARELYLLYSTKSTAGISSFSTGTDLIVLADCINFLYVINGSALLKFSN